MSYLVLARKYRPQTFEDVVAQEHITKTLRNSLTNNRIGSGYLFCGPRGTGKTTTARLLAKAVNCEKGPTPTPCSECTACKEITAGISMDVLEIDAASNTGVDDVRSLRENARYLPTAGNKRIYIIDEVHRLSGAAFDALLKTLEEPPPHVMFIFATTEPSKVPDTILSRTQRYDFKRVSIDDLAAHLGKLATLEKVEIGQDALRLIARKADGSVRDSLSLMDQITAFAGDNVSEQDVIDGLGLIDRQFLFDYTDAIAARDSQGILKQVKQLFDAGTDVKDFVGELLEHLRILMIVASSEEVDDLVNLASDEMELYKKQAACFSVGDIIRLMKIGSDMIIDLKSGLGERLILEMTSVKMAQLESTVLLADILNQLSSGQPAARPANGSDLFGEKKKVNNVTSSSPSGDSLKLVRKQPETVSTSPLQSINLPMLNEGWKDFLALLKQKSQMLASQLAMAKITDVRENCIHILFGAGGEIAKNLVEKSENQKVIIDVIRDHYRAVVTLKLSVDKNNTEISNAAQPDEKKKNIDIKSLMANSPGLQNIVDRFEGEIIGVKESNK